LQLVDFFCSPKLVYRSLFSFINRTVTTVFPMYHAFLVRIFLMDSFFVILFPQNLLFAILSWGSLFPCPYLHPPGFYFPFQKGPFRAVLRDVTLLFKLPPFPPITLLLHSSSGFLSKVSPRLLGVSRRGRSFSSRPTSTTTRRTFFSAGPDMHLPLIFVEEGLLSPIFF